MSIDLTTLLLLQPGGVRASGLPYNHSVAILVRQFIAYTDLGMHKISINNHNTGSATCGQTFRDSSFKRFKRRLTLRTMSNLANRDVDCTTQAYEDMVDDASCPCTPSCSQFSCGQSFFSRVCEMEIQHLKIPFRPNICDPTSQTSVDLDCKGISCMPSSSMRMLSKILRSLTFTFSADVYAECASVPSRNMIGSDKSSCTLKLLCKAVIAFLSSKCRAFPDPQSSESIFGESNCGASDTSCM